MKTHSEYGSIEGYLHLRHDRLGLRDRLRIRDRFTDAETICDASPEVVVGLIRAVGPRVVLYGTVEFIDGAPSRISVKDFDVIRPDSELPTIEDIRAMNLSVPEGKTVEEHLSEMRDDEPRV